jgi:UDP-N-acetylglucosamine transferase subunit ALG13
VTIRPPRRILVLVGTDHHAFDRLVGWADDWSRRHPQDNVRIQFGSSQAPLVAKGVSFLSPAQLKKRAYRADVVITHGGPGTIADARGAGHLPLAVPRDPTLNEHVDDHQVRFAAWAEARGLVRCIPDPAMLDTVIDHLEPSGTRDRVAARTDPADTVQRIQELVRAERLSGRRPPPDRTSVLCVNAGALLDAATLAGRLPGAVLLGDTSAVIAAGEEARCSCGARVSECLFWGKVGDRAFGGWSGDAVLRVRELWTSWGSGRRAKAVLRHPGLSARGDFLEVAGFHRQLFAAACAVADAEVAIDLVQLPSTPLVYSHDRHLDVRVVEVGGGSWFGGRVAAAAYRRRRIPFTTLSSSEVRSDPSVLLRTLDPVAEPTDVSTGRTLSAVSPSSIHAVGLTAAWL